MALNDQMTTLANAIRKKTGASATMGLSEMATAVDGINSGPSIPSGVNPNLLTGSDTFNDGLGGWDLSGAIVQTDLKFQDLTALALDQKPAFAADHGAVAFNRAGKERHESPTVVLSAFAMLTGSLDSNVVIQFRYHGWSSGYMTKQLRGTDIPSQYQSKWFRLWAQLQPGWGGQNFDRFDVGYYSGYAAMFTAGMKLEVAEAPTPYISDDGRVIGQDCPTLKIG